MATDGRKNQLIVAVGGAMFLMFAAGVLALTALNYWLRGNQIFWIDAIAAIMLVAAAVVTVRRAIRATQ